MNLWVSMEDEGARTADENGFNRSLAPLVADLAALRTPRPTYKPYSPKRFEDQARVLLDANVPAFSFIFGIPAKEILEECQAKGIVTIGTATTPDEAAALQKAGVDAIAASGFEAGGHRGSFLRPAGDSLTGTLSLVPQVVDIVDVPVIAAGGTRQKSRNRGRGCEPGRSRAYVGRAKRQSFHLHRCIGFFDLVS
jgi:nitronate monooxygenase